MLLRKFNNLLFDNIDIENNFVVLNINNSTFFDFFSKRYIIFHYKNFIHFGNIFNLFSGNNYFVFVNKYMFFNDLLDLLSNEYDFELLAVSSSNYFINFLNKFFNISSNLFYVFVFFCFFLSFFFNFIFSKFMIIYVKKNKFFLE